MSIDADELLRIWESGEAGRINALIDAAWVPVRYVKNEVRCDFCGRRIPKGAPGNSTGTRGTRCWWNMLRRVYECLDCRTEGFRAEEARAKIDEEQAK
jgi:hypothetical protein